MTRLELITGPMFSSKTSELLKRLYQYAEMGQKVLYINHTLDGRKDNHTFSSHNPLLHESTDSVQKNLTFFKLSKLSHYDFEHWKGEGYQVIGIDEAQFFDTLYDSISWHINFYPRSNMTIIVAGLSFDIHLKPFGQLLQLQPYCDQFDQLHAYCNLCAPEKITKAPFHKLCTKKEDYDEKNSILVGGANEYIAVCRECYYSKQ